MGSTESGVGSTMFGTTPNHEEGDDDIVDDEGQEVGDSLAAPGSQSSIGNSVTQLDPQDPTLLSLEEQIIVSNLTRVDIGGGGGRNMSGQGKGEGQDKIPSPVTPSDPDVFEPPVQAQAHIGLLGGSVSSYLKRPQNPDDQRQNPAFQEMAADLIAAQLERKDKLNSALRVAQDRLLRLRAEIPLLRSKLHPVPSLQSLKDENQRLRVECDLMTREVDLYDNGSVPLGETSEEFYRDINPGQDATALLRGRRPTGTRTIPPPRPPPPRFLPIPSRTHPEDLTTGEWFCSMCTFRNHPDLIQCEQCGMVRVRINPSSAQPGGE